MNSEKSLSKIWRESGKKIAFKDFAEHYNTNIKKVYHSIGNNEKTNDKKDSSKDVLSIVLFVALISGTIYLYNKKIIA